MSSEYTRTISRNQAEPSPRTRPASLTKAQMLRQDRDTAAFRLLYLRERFGSEGYGSQWSLSCLRPKW